jgi:DNA-binding GntR family transcriptional regulator
MWSPPTETPPQADPETYSLTVEAYSTIRDRIVRGELGLGQSVSRRKLAAEMGLGHLPVSAALLLLQFEGLLESRPRAGTRVRIPSPEDIRGHYLVREALEIQGTLVFTQVATAADRAALRKLARRVDALALRRDRLPYLTSHQQLHRRIAEGTRCRSLCDAIERTHAFASIWLGLGRQGSAEDSHRHEEFVETILTGDPATVAQAVRDHLAVSRERSLQILEPYFRLRKTRFARGERTARQTPAPR